MIYYLIDTCYNCSTKVVGGAPLTKSTGDLLASQGVNIACQYGAYVFFHGHSQIGSKTTTKLVYNEI